MKQGPNVRALIVRKMSVDMVPAGSGLEDVKARMANVGEYARTATAWVEAAINAVKSAPDNRFGDDDEAIAGEILRRAGIEPKG